MNTIPDLKQFLKLSTQGNLVPVYQEILGDLETPVSAYLKIAAKASYAFLLESVEGGEKVSRYSILAKDPEVVFLSQNNTNTMITFNRHGTKKMIPLDQKDPLTIIERYMRQYRFVPVKGLPRFCGGLIGYIGYDMVRFFERLPQRPNKDVDLPELMLSLTKNLIIFDHLTHTLKIVSCVDVHPNDSIIKKKRAYQQALTRIQRTIKDLKQPYEAKIKKTKKVPTLHIRSNVTKKKFMHIVDQAKQEIRKGEIIQVVLSQRFQCDIQTNAISVYRALRMVNPSPYMYLLKFDDIHIVGSSPEALVRCENGLVETRPIAGTRPRGRTEQEDQCLAKALLADPKERAEHIMLVDLGRNDLGRVCQKGSVHLSDFMTIELYSHVMHIVSNVRGRLRKDKNIFDVFRSAFPAGTVSGAPKIRAMEIIDRLENVSRGPYAGCIGYFSFSGNLDTCITIRTIVIQGQTAYIQAGAGIVADSDPLTEFIETSNKAKAQISALGLAHQISQ